MKRVHDLSIPVRTGGLVYPGNPEIVIESQQAGWVAQTYITPDTEAIDARATAALTSAQTDLAKRAARLPAGSLSPDQLRQVTVLKNTLTMAAPRFAARWMFFTRS